MKAPREFPSQRVKRTTDNTKSDAQITKPFKNLAHENITLSHKL
jgi:hypothetical protein